MAGSKSQSTVCQHCGGPIPKGGRPNRKFCKPSCRTLAYRARQLSAQQAAAPPERAAAPPCIPDALHPEVVASLSRVRELEATVDRMIGQCTELTRELANSAAQLSEANHQRARLEEELKRQQREHAEQLQKLQPPASPPKPQIAAAAPAPGPVVAPVAVAEAAPARRTAVPQEPAAPAVPPGATVAPAPAAPAAPPGVTAAAPASAAPRRFFSAGLCSLRGIVAPAVLPPPRPGVLGRVQALFRRSPTDPTRPIPRR